MPFSHSTRRWAAWITLWSLVLGAVLPAAAHAVAAVRAPGQVLDICSATGIVRTVVDTEGNGSNGSDSTSGTNGTTGLDYSQHCPWCTVHAGAAGLPPEPAAFVAVAVATGYLADWPVGVVVAPGWRPGIPRAPPRA